MSLTITYYLDQLCTQPNPSGLFWRALRTAELGNGSSVVAQGWVRWKAQWGNSSFKIVAWDAGKPIGEADYRKDYWPLPAGTRSFTAEGHRDHPGVQIDVDLIQLAK